MTAALSAVTNLQIVAEMFRKAAGRAVDPTLKTFDPGDATKLYELTLPMIGVRVSIWSWLARRESK
jgi:hypothetical protein